MPITGLACKARVWSVIRRRNHEARRGREMNTHPRVLKDWSW